jgi:hypothetical protein
MGPHADRRDARRSSGKRLGGSTGTGLRLEGPPQLYDSPPIHRGIRAPAPMIATTSEESAKGT